MEGALQERRDFSGSLMTSLWSLTSGCPISHLLPHVPNYLQLSQMRSTVTSPVALASTHLSDSTSFPEPFPSTRLTQPLKLLGAHILLSLARSQSRT